RATWKLLILIFLSILLVLARGRGIKSKFTITRKRLFREVTPPRVFLDHAPGVELGHQRCHRAADFLDPLSWDPIGVPIEEARNNFLGQCLVKIFAVATVLILDGVRM